jgi:hypothetical protein
MFMRELNHTTIGRMEWDAFREELETTATRAPSKAASSGEEKLREYFGDEEFDALLGIAREARATRARAGELGNVVFLPGIMGSNLITVDRSGDEDLVWINLFRIALGRLAGLKLTDDGKREAARTSGYTPA